MSDELLLRLAIEHPELLASPVGACISQWQGSSLAEDFWVAEIDPDVADTAAMCERYGVALEDSANCVVVAGKRGDEVRMAACVVLATTKADVNGAVRRRLEARKASFAPMDDAVAQSGMEYGGITPFGLPKEWPVFVDSRVLERKRAIFGSGIRKSKLFAPGRVLLDLPAAVVVDELGS